MDTQQPKQVCTSSIPWWLSFCVSAAIFVLGLIIIGFIYLGRYIKGKRPPPLKHEIIRRKSRIPMDIDSDDERVEEDDVTNRETGILRIRLWCERVTSRSTYVGRITCLLQVGLNLLSWGIYIAFSHYQISDYYLEGDCYRVNMNILKWIDFGLNLFFALHFILRAFAALDILKFWVLPTTLVDICVIPNIIITSLIDVRRQGMSFLRAIYLRYFVDYILVTFGFMKINSKTQIFILIVYLLSVWMIGSGFIHLLENVGDFWVKTGAARQEWTYWECCYFMLVTVSTVGYGDYSPKTVLGRLLVCVYIIYAYALFGSSIPQIVYTFKNSKYHEKYVTRHGEKHIIVTGLLENNSLKNFLAPFIMKTRNNSKSLKLIIVNEEQCDRNLSIFLKTVSTRIKYIMGSPQNSTDTERANIRKAKAAVVLTQPQMKKGIDDDSENIMTAISLKAQKERIRTIVQLHLYSNKIMLKMFPKWDRYGTDVIVCMDEIRLGLMAYNCLVPGIATLITNLLCSNETQLKKKLESSWRKNYEEGLNNRIFSVEFSDNFHGMQCSEVAKIIYKLFDVCLLAIKYDDEVEDHRVIINPSVEKIQIDSQNMVALVIARDESSASRVSFYCQRCSPSGKSTKICKCLINSFKRNNHELKDVKVNYHNRATNLGDDKNNNHVIKKREYDHVIKNKSYQIRDFPMVDYLPYNLEADTNINIDATGSFYWAKTPKFEDICIDIATAESRNLADHILICLCGNGDGIIDLSNFMMPLRFRVLFGNTLRPIVILGNQKYFKDNKWINIKNFPFFLIIDGSPIQARHLRAAGLFRCFAVAVINANDFKTDADDKQTLFCTTLIRSLRNQRIPKADFTTISEIRNEEIASFLSSAECHEDDTKLSVDHTEPFARGLLFSNSVLYRCIHSIYYNPEIFYFLTAMIGGPNFNQVEKMFGSGAGLMPKSENEEIHATSDMLFKLLPLKEHPFSDVPGLGEGTLTYETLFLWALEVKQVLCLGLYRCHVGRRPYVFTNPKKNTLVSITDKVYCCLNNEIMNSKL